MGKSKTAGVLSSADHFLIDACRHALDLLKPRLAPNGIGYTATTLSQVARGIREAAQAKSCKHCGRVYWDESGFMCDCPENKV